MVKTRTVEYKINRKCLRRFKRCLVTIFGTKFSNSTLLFIFFFSLCLGQQIIVYQTGLLPSEFFLVLGKKEPREYKFLIIKAFSVILGVSLYKSCLKLVSGYLYLKFRTSLTDCLHQLYFYKTTVYHVNVTSDRVDNVDQRITQDVDRFSLQLSDVAATFLISPIIIIYYSVQCFKATGYLGPIIIYVYFFIGTVINKLIMSTIVPVVFKQEKAEGDFRFKHSDIRMNAESIALTGGVTNEFRKANLYFCHLLNIQKLIVHKELFLNTAVNLFDYIGSILSYIVISIPIFAGHYDDLSSLELTSLISKTSFVSLYLINCFTQLIDMCVKLTDCLGYAHRIGELIEILEILHKSADHDDRKKFKISNQQNQVLLRCTNLSYKVPGEPSELIKNLNFTLLPNDNTLISGKTGVGKSSLFRIIANVWKTSTGSITLLEPTSPTSVLFVPQKSYLTNGSLLELIIYPQIKSKIKNWQNVRENVESCLINVGLGSLIERVGDIDIEPTWRWADVLSPGEIQRIAFARLFFYKPFLAILDESTSCLSVHEEECFYIYLNRIGVTYLSIGHRETLRQYHKKCLFLKGDAEWEMYDI